MPSGMTQFVHDLAHLVAVFAFDAARHATGTRVVRHEHQEAAGEGDERGEGSALVAAFFLFDLDDDFLALGQQVAHVGAPAVGLLPEVILGNFLQRQEAVAFRTVIDKAGFERGLDARDSAFVDVGFFLFLGRYLDGKIEQFLTINQRDSQLLLLSCIDEHSLHLNWTLMTSVGPTRFERRISSRTALQSTARRGGACREAKDCRGVTCIHVVCPSHDGAERQNPLGYFTDGRARCVFWTAFSAAIQVGLRAMASLPRTN